MTEFFKFNDRALERGIPRSGSLIFVGNTILSSSYAQHYVLKKRGVGGGGEEVLLLVASRKEIAISSSWVGHLTQLQPSLQVIERMVLE